MDRFASSNTMTTLYNSSYIYIYNNLINTSWIRMYASRWPDLWEIQGEEEEGGIRKLGLSRFRFSLPHLVMDSFASTYEQSLREALQRSTFSFVLTDPRIHENPIVYASDGFLSMTGYTAEEVLGRNCRFLQGPATDRRTVMEIRDAIREERSCQVSILNYTKQGKAFWNLFHMAPVFSREDGRVVHYLGVQTPINPSLLEEDSQTFVQGLKTLPSHQVSDDESGTEEKTQPLLLGQFSHSFVVFFPFIGLLCQRISSFATLLTNHYYEESKHPMFPIIPMILLALKWQWIN